MPYLPLMCLAFIRFTEATCFSRFLIRIIAIRCALLTKARETFSSLAMSTGRVFWRLFSQIIPCCVVGYRRLVNVGCPPEAIFVNLFLATITYKLIGLWNRSPVVASLPFAPLLLRRSLSRSEKMVAQYRHRLTVLRQELEERRARRKVALGFCFFPQVFNDCSKGSALSIALDSDCHEGQELRIKFVVRESFTFWVEELKTISEQCMSFTVNSGIYLLDRFRLSC